MTEEGYIITDNKNRSTRLKDLEELKELIENTEFPSDIATMVSLITLEATDTRRWWEKLLNVATFGECCKRDMSKDQRVAINNFKKEMGYE